MLTKCSRGSQKRRATRTTSGPPVHDVKHIQRSTKEGTMDRHEFRLSWMVTAYGALSSALIALIIPKVYVQLTETNAIIFGTHGLSLFQWGMGFATILIPLVILIAGLVSLITKSVMHNLGLVAACLLLLSFPIGTVLGAYYLCYRFIYCGRANA